MPPWSSVLRRVASPLPLAGCDGQPPLPSRPESPHRRTVSGSSDGSNVSDASHSTKSLHSSVGTTSTLPEYLPEEDGEDPELEAVIGGLQDLRMKKKMCKCTGKCLSFVFPSNEEVVDLNPSETPQFTTSLRPPPRSPSQRSPSQHSSSAFPSPVHFPFPVLEYQPSLPSLTASTGSSKPSLASEGSVYQPSEDGDSDSEYESAAEDDGESLKRTKRRPSKPPTLLIRSTLPHGLADTRCACADPFCPGGELDRAYDAVVPCNCNLPGCLGGEMALAWKLRADGLRKSGRHRHVSAPVQKTSPTSPESKGIVWGYNIRSVSASGAS